MSSKHAFPGRDARHSAPDRSSRSSPTDEFTDSCLIEDDVTTNGANGAKQCIEAKVLGILVFIAPVLIGDGVRLFDHPGAHERTAGTDPRGVSALVQGHLLTPLDRAVAAEKEQDRPRPYIVK